MDNILIMKKKYLFMATAAIMMAGCASDDLVGDENISNGNAPIAFNMNTSKVTRAPLNDKQAADSLGNEFIVWGEKSEANDGTAASAENLVFKNYRVQYTKGSTGSTVSNTDDWEYVGITPYDDGNTVKVSPSIGTSTKQTIKYWDDAASSYTFTAVSASNSDITNGRVKITKTQTGTGSSNQVYTKGYTITVGAGANPARIYVADRKPVTKVNSSTTYARNAVQLQFRNFMSKVRFGIYENIPGYKVVITGIKFNNGTSKTPVEHPTKDTTPVKTFGIDGNFITPGANTKYKVTYVASGNNTNKAQVEVVSDNSNTPATKDTLQTAGTTWLSTTKDSPIATASSSPTYDNAGTYKIIMPNPTNNKGMTLTISYDLYSEDTGEKISVGYRTAEVPAEYCQWKSNYAYTYLFKITDKSADLYPITFDAVVETEENGNQETITSVSEPSITTFGAKTDSNSKTAIVHDENEYVAGDVIYATVIESNKLVNLTTSNIQLYTVTTTDATKYPITEASVAHAIEQAAKNPAASNPKIVATKIGTSGITANDNLVNVVPTEDGKTITLDKTENNPGTPALKWTAADNTVYAIEYSKTEGETTTKTYKIVIINGAKTTTQAQAGS